MLKVLILGRIKLNIDHNREIPAKKHPFSITVYNSNKGTSINYVSLQGGGQRFVTNLIEDTGICTVLRFTERGSEQSKNCLMKFMDVP
jgi:hypothetical protein